MQPLRRSTRFKASASAVDPSQSTQKKTSPKASRAKPLQTTSPIAVVQLPHLPEAPLPPGALPLSLPGRDPRLPDIFLLPSHSKVHNLKKDGRILLVVSDWRHKAQEQQFLYLSKLEPPKNRKDSVKRGNYLLYPSRDDRIVSRDRYGSGHESGDKIVSWATSRDEVEDHIPALVDLQGRLLGEEKDMTASKATVEDGVYSGGINFERHFKARSLKNGPRCYPLSTTIQIQKDMSAVGLQGKVFEATKDADALMRFDLLHLGSELAMGGLWKGGDDLQPVLKTQADFTNLPRVGSDRNIAHPAFQLNVVSAVKPSSKGVAAISALGKFGSSHVDANDSPSAPTAMTILSPEYDGVEEEIFYVIDFGIGWVMEEFSTLFFSGLHFHGGCQPTYKARRRDTGHIYYRLTLIAYPPDILLSGMDTVAFATLPNKTVLPIGHELRNPDTAHSISYRVQSKQATYTGDGSSIFEPYSQLRHFSWACGELVTSLVRQLDPVLVARVDIEQLTGSFSCLVDGVRVRAPDRSNGPGWRDDDVRIGKVYKDLLQSRFEVATVSELAIKNPEGLVSLCNTDSDLTDAPYGNELYQSARLQWKKHMDASSANIPLLGALKCDNVLGGRIGSRAKGLVKSARSSSGKGSNKAGSAEEKKKRANRALKLAIKKGKLAVSSSKPYRKLRSSTADEDAMHDDRIHSVPESEEPMEGIQSADPAYDGSYQVDGSDDIEMVDRSILFSLQSNRFLESAGELQSSQSSVLIPLDLKYLIIYEEMLIAMSSISSGDSSLLAPALVDISRFRQEPLTGKSRNVATIFALHTSRCDQYASNNRINSIILEMLLLDSIEFKVQDSWPFPSQTSSVNPMGIQKLVIDVARALAHRPVDVTLDVVDYLPGFLPQEGLHRIAYQNRALSFPTAIEIHDRVVRILFEWLSLPDPQKIYPRVWFALEVVKRFGVYGLRLPFIQEAAYHVRKDVLQIGKNKQVDRDMISQWFAHNFDTHPTCDPKTDSWLTLARILDLSAILFPLDKMIVEAVDRTSLKDPRTLGDPSSSRLAFYASLQARSTTASVNHDAHELERLFVLLSALYPLVPNLQAGSPASDLREKVLHNKFLKVTVRKLLDQRLPFRNLAPSRKRILEGNGPYSPQWNSTIPGFFSAVVYRGVTHSTEFLLSAPIMFKDPTHYQCVYDSFGERESSFFCNKGAFGQPCDNRTVENVPTYWEMVNMPENNLWLASSQPAAFFCVYDIALKFPAFGELTACQLVMDFVECGKVAPPTLEEMGRLVYKLKKGAYHGLMKLGFEVDSEEKVVGALSFLQAALEDRIPAVIKPQIDFGLIFIEHLLCKLKRLDRKPFEAYCTHVMTERPA